MHVAYQVFGAGPVELVVVPGFTSHLEVIWEHPLMAGFYRRLASFARVVVFDKRGTGMSDPVSGAPTLEERMDDVRAVMDAAGFDRAAIFGISEGGALAMLFAASHPRARHRADHLRVLCAACLGRGLPTWLSPGCLGCV